MLVRFNSIFTGWRQKMLKNDKTVIYDLVTTVGPAGLRIKLTEINNGIII